MMPTDPQAPLFWISDLVPSVEYLGHALEKKH